MTLTRRTDRNQSRRARAFAATLAVIGMAVAMLGLSQSASAAPSPSMQWMTSTSGAINGPGQTMAAQFGAFGVTGTVTGVSNTNDGAGAGLGWQSGVGFAGGGADPTIDPYIETDPPAAFAGITQFRCCTPNGATGGQVFSFNKPVIAPVLHFFNIDGAFAVVGGTTTAGAPIVFTPLANNIAMDVAPGNIFNAVTANPIPGPSCQDNANPTNSNGACGSFRMNGPGETIQSFNISDVGQWANGDGWVYSVSFPTAPLTKVFNPSPIHVGETSTLTFSITNPNNPGQVTLAPLDFADVLPNNVTVANSNVSNNGNCGSPLVEDSSDDPLSADDTGVHASNISVAVGATCTITINVTSTTPGTYVNDNDNLSTDVANLVPNADTTLVVLPLADVEIEKLATSPPVVPGTETEYTLRVTNNGPSTATNVVASDPLPSGASFVSASAGCAEAGGTVTCSIASLDAGDFETFTVTTAAAADASCEDLANTATVESDIDDPDMDNNSSTVDNCEPRADVEIEKLVSSPPVVPGTETVYTLRVTNNGPSTARNVVASDPLPSGLSFVSASAGCAEAGGTVTCSIASLDPGDSQTFTVTTRAAANAECADLANTATVASDTADPDTSNNSSTVNNCGPRADVVINKTVSAPRALVGESVTYTLEVVNNGPSAAVNPRVTDTVPSRLDARNASTSRGECSLSGNAVVCQLGRMLAGETATITVRAVAIRAGQATNSASVTDERCANTPCGTDEVPLRIVKPKLVLKKKVSRRTMQAGDTAVYTIRVTNPTEVAVKAVKVCDRLPAGLAFVSAKPRARLASGQHCWRVSRLGAGASRKYRVTFRALPGARGTKVNRACARAPQARAGCGRVPIDISAGDVASDIVTG